MPGKIILVCRLRIKLSDSEAAGKCFNLNPALSFRVLTGSEVTLFRHWEHPICQLSVKQVRQRRARFWHWMLTAVSFFSILLGRWE